MSKRRTRRRFSAEEAGLPNRHMVAHNLPQQSGALSSGFDVINEHSPAAVSGTTIAGADALRANQYSGATVQASVTSGKQHVAYLHHGRVPSNSNFQLNYNPIDNSNQNTSLRVSLPSGNWKGVWTKPQDLSVLKTQQFSHGGGNVTLDSVTYQADVALRIDKVETSTAPSAPTGVRIEIL